jgi:hypothetical protein
MEVVCNSVCEKETFALDLGYGKITFWEILPDMYFFQQEYLSTEFLTFKWVQYKGLPKGPYIEGLMDLGKCWLYQIGCPGGEKI